MKTARQYRFSPLDTTGWLYGLNGQQCILLGAGVLASGLLLDVHAPALAVAAPILISLTLAFTRIGNDSILDRAAIEFSIVSMRVTRRSTWTVSPTKPLPPFLSHLEITTLEGTDIGVTVNHAASTVSATITASTRGFVLNEDGDQDYTLELWSEVLSTYATTTSPVMRISLCESTMHGNHAGHVTFVTLTASSSRTVRCRSRQQKSPLVDQLNLLATHLRNNGLIVDEPLTREELTNAMTSQLSGTSPRQKRTLAGITQLRRSTSRTESSRHSIEIDGIHHRSYWIAQWPATNAAASWLEPLLMHDNLRRTLTIHMEPVPRLASRRSASKIATKLETDATQKERAGFRVDETHRRTRQAAADRESELGAGYAEFQYVGLITVTHSSASDLQASCLELEQVASICGMELSPLEGRHDLGLLCSLPLGQCPARKRLSA
jgi:hypothetical protein